MLCSKCHKSIPRGEEIQIKGSIICQECSLAIKKEDKERIIARCWNCNRFIYKSELIHEIIRSDSKNFSKWFSIGIGGSEKLFQCDECYQAWRNKVKKSRNLSKLKSLFLGLCIGIFLGAVIELFFPEIDKRMNNNPSLTFILTISLFTILLILGPILETNRHEIRERLKKKRKIKK